MKWTIVLLALAVAGVAGCGDASDDRATTTPTAESSPTSVIDGEEEIVIKTSVDLASVVDTGKVLDGSTLGDWGFCPGGTTSGGHGNTDNGWLDKTFECPNGTLTIAFDPRNEKKNSLSGPWEVLSGTDAYQGMEGFGEMKIKFSPDPQVLKGHETFTGTVSQ